jgi:hypothetical protein
MDVAAWLAEVFTVFLIESEDVKTKGNYWNYELRPLRTEIIYR